MPVELVPLASIPAEEQLDLAREARQAAFRDTPAFLIRVRRDRRLVRFEADGRLSHSGNGGQLAGTWSFRCHHGEVVLVVVEPEGGRRLLYEDPDGIFREAQGSGRERMEIVSLQRRELGELN
jgi:hypothetical protein